MQLRSAISMLVEVGVSSKKVYEVEFERTFIKETESYYRQESNKLIVDSSCDAFLQIAKKRLNQELDRLLNYLDSSSEVKLIQIFLKEFIEAHAQTLLTMEHSGLISMIRGDSFEQIGLMFEMFSRVPTSFDLLK